MKKLIAVWAICLLLRALPVNAGDCRPLEYAQIQDMDDSTVANTFCLYQNLGNIYRETGDSFSEMYLKEIRSGGGGGRIRREIQAMRMGAQECDDGLVKLRTAMDKRKLWSGDKCEVPPSMKNP